MEVGGLTVRTGMDPAMQAAAEKVIEARAGGMEGDVEHASVDLLQGAGGHGGRRIGWRGGRPVVPGWCRHAREHHASAARRGATACPRRGKPCVVMSRPPAGIGRAPAR
jgi:hypothetical protein